MTMFEMDAIQLILEILGRNKNNLKLKMKSFIGNLDNNKLWEIIPGN